MRRLWSDDELDQALAELHADVRPSADGLAAAKERMLTGKPVRSRRFRRTWLPIVAAVAAIVLVTAVVVLLPHTAQPATPASTPVSLQELLSKIHYSDPGIAPGQYWYTRSAEAAGRPPDLLDDTMEIWRPAKWTDVWQDHRTSSETHTYKYANGTITIGPARTSSVVDQTMWAGCGDFRQQHAPDATHLPCDSHREPPSFDWPTPDWVAGLSADPAGILAQLNSAQLQGRRPLDLPINALTTGLFPAKLRAAIYQAVAMMPGAYGLQNVPNLDGRVGYAIGLHLDGYNDELLIDPADGTYLGERLYEPKTGDVYRFSGMRYGVVDKQGVTPK